MCSPSASTKRPCCKSLAGLQVRELTPALILDGVSVALHRRPDWLSCAVIAGSRQVESPGAWERRHQ
jgi:hypothetical protein